MDKYSNSSTFSDQSRSYSNRSSETKSDVIETPYGDEDSFSPASIECQIQAQRITKVLKQAIYKTKLAICIPTLVSEYVFLSTHLSECHMADLLKIFEIYENPQSLVVSFFGVDRDSEELNMPEELPSRISTNKELMGHLIYIMNSYPALEPKINEMIDTMKAKEQISVSEKPNPALNYLLTLEKFVELMVRQLNTSAGAELALKLKQQRLEKSNNKYLKDIDGFNTSLKEEEERHKEGIRQRKEKIMRLEAELARKSAESATKLKKQILDSDRVMVLHSREHAMRAAALKYEEADSKAAYTELLEQNFKAEKAQRMHRMKIETKLQSWLQKYDLEITDKQEELDETIRLYNDEVRLTKELEQKLVDQDLEYIPLMQEREEEYQRELLEKMSKFQREHAARVIQNAYRLVLAHRQEVKKLTSIRDELRKKISTSK